MDVIAYDSGTGAQVQLGSIAEQIWTNGFKRTQARTIQVSKPINAAAPNLFDRLTLMETFQFAAGQSFPDVGSADLGASELRPRQPDRLAGQLRH